MDPITANFNINGDDLLVWGITGEKVNKTFWINNAMMNNPYPSLPSDNTKHPYSLIYNRGKSASLNGDGNWLTYDRSLYQYGAGKQWKFNKYKSVGVLADEYSASETNNTPNLIDYMDNDGHLLPGAYPISYRAYGSDDTLLPEYERTTIFKLNYYNTSNMLDAESAKKMICWKMEGVFFPETQYLFFSFQYATGAYYGKIGNNGDIGKSNPAWPTSTGDYNRNFARGFGDMDVCPVSLMNDYARDVQNKARICLTAKKTTPSGEVKYWSWDNRNPPRWDATPYTAVCRRYKEEDTGCYEFERVIDMPAPTRNGGQNVPLTKESVGYWLELPTTYCDLELWIGVIDESVVPAYSVIMRNFNIEQVGMEEVFGEINEAFERKDTIYSTDVMTNNTFPDVTFNLCSNNLYNGLASLYYNGDVNRLDTLTYPIGNEKIEQHYLRLITKLFSQYEIFNDEIYLDDLKFNYADRWFNGGTLNLINGTVEGQFIKHNNNINGNI
jgi:hypothetical protein